MKQLIKQAFTAFSEFLKNLNGAFIFIAITGFGAIYFICKSCENMHMALITALAAFAAGSLIGFLFGIPRTLQKSNSTESTEFIDNTNLEQISDWLTKIIVGVGLTQINEIRYNFYIISKDAGEAILLKDQPGATFYAGALMLFFAIEGFLFMYLWTRLRLLLIQKRNMSEAMKGELKEEMRGELVETSDNLLQEAAKKISTQDYNDKNANNIAFKQLNHGSDIADISTDEMYEVLKEASGKTVSDIYIMTVNYRKANWKDNASCVAKTFPIFEALIRLDTEINYPENYSQYGYALKDTGDYLKARDNFNIAIEEFRRKGISHGFSMISFNRAICSIKIEGNFDQNLKSSEENKAAIQADIDEAMKDALVAEIIPGTIIKEWQKLNDL